MASEPEIKQSPAVLEWTFPEFTVYERGRWWYLTFFIVGTLMILLAILSGTYTAIPVVILAGFILILRFRRHPADVHVRITELGIEVGGMFTRWDDLKEFWIIYRPPEIKKLYVAFKLTIRQPFSIELGSLNPLKVRQALAEFLPENVDEERETAGDQLLRFFKL